MNRLTLLDSYQRGHTALVGVLEAAATRFSISRQVEKQAARQLLRQAAIELLQYEKGFCMWPVYAAPARTQSASLQSAAIDFAIALEGGRDDAAELCDCALSYACET